MTVSLRRTSRAREAAFAAGLCAALSAHLPAGELAPYEGGAQAPPLALEDTNGRPHRIEDLRGEVVLVNFWASWCPPCIKEMPSIRRVSESLADRPFKVLAVNVGESAAMARRFREPLGEDVIILVDDGGRVFEAWGGRIMPTSFLVDTAGRVRYRALGEVEWDGAEALGSIEALMPDRSQDENEMKAPETLTAGGTDSAP